MRKITYYFLLTALLMNASFGQINISGALSGTLIDTLYLVQGDIYVGSGASLTIQPGAIFYFTGDYDFDISGNLQCSGSETDSIKFLPYNPGIYWGGINFTDLASDNSVMEYCVISGSHLTGLEISYCSPLIRHCLIRDNQEGGIYCSFSNTVIEYCTIEDNDASSGGGISCFHFSPVIDHCLIIDNSAFSEGGGIKMWSCTNASINNCTICANSSLDGSGISLNYSQITILNCIIAYNLNGSGVHFASSNNSSVKYSDFFDNQDGNFTGNYSGNLGLVLTLNANGDSCDVYKNLYLDPLFENQTSGDYNLIWGSPCIDAGDTTSPLDPDGTVADMGAFYYDRLSPQPPSPFSLIAPQNGDTCWTLSETLIWGDSEDPNLASIPFFDVYLDTNFSLNTKWIVADSIPDTTFNLMNLNDDKAYYWTVRATDNNTAGTWAIDTLMFRTYHPQPIEPFALLQPADGAVLNPGVTLFRWEEAVDPDPGDPVNCTLWFVQGDDSIGYEIGNRTSMLVLPDTITILIPYLSATWYVSAQSSSPYCVLSSEERFTFVVPSAVEGEFQGGIPSEFRLYPPFPNPFNEVVFINFDLPEKCPVNLAIYNIRGQKVCLLTDGIYEPGNHTLNFDADGLSSGVFIVQLQAGNFRSIQKVVLLK